MPARQVVQRFRIGRLLFKHLLKIVARLVLFLSRHHRRQQVHLRDATELARDQIFRIVGQLFVGLLVNLIEHGVGIAEAPRLGQQAVVVFGQQLIVGRP